MTATVQPSPRPRESAADSYFDAPALARENLRGRAVRGAAARVFAQSCSSVVQFVSGIALARLLVPADFGLVAMVTAYSMVLMDVGALGLSTAVIQAQRVTHEQVSSLFWVNAGIGVAMALVFGAGGPALAWLYAEPRLTAICLAISTAFVFRGLATQHQALLHRNMRFVDVAMLEFAAGLGSAVTAIVMAWFGWGYWALVARRVLLHSLTACGAWLMCSWRPGFNLRSDGTRPLLSFGLHTIGAQALQTVSTDRMVIGWRYGADALGLYDRANQLFVLPFNQLTSPLSSVVVSALSKLREEPDRFQRYFLRTVEVIAALGMGLGALLTVTGQDLILLMLGPQWRHSGTIFAASAPGIGILLLSRAHGWLHVSIGRADRLLAWTMVVPVITTLGLIAGLPFGTVGVAVAYSVVSYLLFLPGISYAGRPIGLRWTTVCAVMWRYFASAAIAVVVCWYTLGHVDAISTIYAGLSVSVRLAMTLILCIVLYLALVVALHGSVRPVMDAVRLFNELGPRRTQSRPRSSTQP